MKEFKAGTKRAEIKRYADSGVSWADAFRAIKPLVLSQTLPWVFSANVGGARRPKQMGAQLVDLKNEIRRVYALLGREADDMEVDTTGDEIPPIEETQTEERKPRKKANSKREEMEYFMRELRRIRQWISDRASANGSKEIDDIKGVRPIIAARAAIEEGIPAKAMLYAMGMHWGSDTLAAAGIEKVDFLDYCESRGEGYHRLTDYVIKLAHASKRCGGLIPIMMIGPAGVSKSTIARNVAEILDVPFGFVPVTAGATPSWLLGRYTTKQDDTGGFVLSEFLRIYSEGGVFLFDEIDAGDPNMLLVVNNAIAGDSFPNPINGETYHKSANFIPMAAANTFGLGANSTYTGRERIDGATIDRFRMGRLEVGPDTDLENYLAFG